MNHRTCKVCGSQIDPRRLKLLPETKTCPQHSTDEKKIGTSITFGYGDEIYTDLNIMSAEEHDRFERLKRRYNE